MTPYQPLAQGTFRLLHVHRKKDGTIAGELKSVPLAVSKGTYTTISYCWGLSKDFETIDIHGIPLKVSPNAYAILNMFCDLPKSKDKVWIWLDSLCINQENIAEKGSQVGLMAAIYTNAKRVFVWLGEGNERTDKGIELMRTLALYGAGYPVPVKALRDLQTWQGFSEVALRPWFQRVWTLQESILPDDSIFYCGTKCLTGKEVRQAVLVTIDHFPPDLPLNKSDWAQMWSRRRIHQWLEKSDGISVLTFLAHECRAAATNPRDYLYSLLGCVKPRDRQIIGEPHYDTDTNLTYLNIAKRWILEYRSLDIIPFAMLFRGDSEYPSWAPDWQSREGMQSKESNPVPLLVSQPNKLDVGSMLPPRFARFSQPKSWADSPIYATSGTKPLAVNFSDDLSRLEVSGVFLGTIDGLGALPASPDISTLVQSTAATNSTRLADEEIAIVTEIFLNLVFGRADVYLQYEADPLATLNEVLAILSAIKPDRPTSDKNTQEFVDWARANESLLIRGCTFGHALKVALEDFAVRETGPLEAHRCRDEDRKNAVRHPFLRKFKYAAFPEWMNRGLAVTDQGVVGMVPHDTEKGDVVCVLFGCSVPMVLRSDGDSYRVVGECYMHGFMEGQALEAAYDEQSFILV